MADRFRRVAALACVMVVLTAVATGKAPTPSEGVFLWRNQMLSRLFATVGAVGAFMLILAMVLPCNRTRLCIPVRAAVFIQIPAALVSLGLADRAFWLATHTYGNWHTRFSAFAAFTGLWLLTVSVTIEFVRQNTADCVWRSQTPDCPVTLKGRSGAA